MGDIGARRSRGGAAGNGPAIRMIDWDLARRGAAALTPPGPRMSVPEALAVVESLHGAARRARGPVAESTAMQPPAVDTPVFVVDRPTWVAANVESFAALVDPVVERMVRSSGRGYPSAAAQRVGGLITGAEVAGLLSFVSTKALGQYDLGISGMVEPRLLLVAPNVVEVERELDLDPQDFRLWVCLHEETHRVQFTAVPWLRDHVLELSRRTAQLLAPDAGRLMERFTMAARNAPQALREGGTGLAELFLNDEQRTQVAEVGAVMSLLEGHADVVMDEVGPKVVPSVGVIRARFDRRRHTLSGPDALVRRLLGLEAKMAQYRDGAVFVRHVVDKVGTDGFNAVWSAPDMLPTAAEIRHPSQWVARVHG